MSSQSRTAGPNNPLQVTGDSVSFLFFVHLFEVIPQTSPLSVYVDFSVFELHFLADGWRLLNDTFADQCLSDIGGRDETVDAHTAKKIHGRCPAKP